MENHSKTRIFDRFQLSLLILVFFYFYWVVDLWALSGPLSLFYSVFRLIVFCNFKARRKQRAYLLFCFRLFVIY